MRKRDVQTWLQWLQSQLVCVLLAVAATVCVVIADWLLFFRYCQCGGEMYRHGYSGFSVSLSDGGAGNSCHSVCSYS